MPDLSRTLRSFFPPKATFTDQNVGDLAGKVYFITGATSGLGKELAKTLFAKNAKVYIASRDEAKMSQVINEIKASASSSKGSLAALQLDLTDLTTVKPAVEKFLSAESRLHVLFNNAGYMSPEGPTERTAQGYEKHLAINCLGAFLLTKLLTPTLVATAKHPGTPANTVRVVYMSSFGAEMFAEKDIGIPMDNLDYHEEKGAKARYGYSKAGSWFYAVELTRRLKDEGGVIGIAVNPGNLRTDLFRHQGFMFRTLTNPLHYPAVNGMYTQLWAGFSPEVTLDKGENYGVPFGRLESIRRDLVMGAGRSEADGGNGQTAKFWDWSEDQVKNYL